MQINKMLQNFMNLKEENESLKNNFNSLTKVNTVNTVNTVSKANTFNIVNTSTTMKQTIVNKISWVIFILYSIRPQIQIQRQKIHKKIKKSSLQ